MLIDYLRYLAFDGRLQGFFESGYREYIRGDLSATTGQHLRFAPDDLDQRLRWHGQEIVSDLYLSPHSSDLTFERLKADMGLSGGPDGLTVRRFEIGDPPATSTYTERHPPKLEIIIDIDPDHWDERYSESRSYENIPIVYRRIGPAKGNVGSGDKILDRQRRDGHGTLCGIFCPANQAHFGLTCGHVAANGTRILIEQQRSIFPLWSRFTDLGEVRFVTTPQVIADSKGPVRNHLDAALIQCESEATVSRETAVIYRATVQPISTVLQEEPVAFRGASSQNMPARVTAVTVRKSIDLFRDGNLHNVGDVLMLGHRQPMYFAQRVSLPGDSGAAVRQGFSSTGPFTELNRWYGMILGGDDAGAYATHAEHLWSWAAQQIGDPNVAFLFET